MPNRKPVVHPLRSIWLKVLGVQGKSVMLRHCLNWAHFQNRNHVSRDAPSSTNRKFTT